MQLGGAEGAFGGVEADEAVEDGAVGKHGVEPIDRCTKVAAPLIPLVEIQIVVTRGDGKIRERPPPTPPTKGER